MTGYVLEKLEEAFVNYLSASVATTYTGSMEYYKGVDSVEIEGNSIICYASNMEEIDTDVSLGIFQSVVSLRIGIPYVDSGSLDQRNFIVDSAVQALTADNLIGQLTGSTNNLNIFYIADLGHNSSFSSNGYIYSIDYGVVATLT